ncbi:family 20 glycosylhydrolase [Polaribacter batillariae]|uniref:Family 20 glycosylhydrolase n=1 Tax=Polaribacter batillariae TaxID=2808900 RepID=A0ABX7SUV9_9FLAO|nr:glycoside hydrolase family 20 protein [Polaribacter batillariae]QTD37125.1 family 20 glycosylhydrolase [Polaribacter batillariae]
MKKILTSLLIIAQITIFAQERLNVVPAVQNWQYSGKDVLFNSVFVNWSEGTSSKESLFLNRFKTELKSLNIKVRKSNNKNALSIFFDTKYTPVNKHKDSYKIIFGRKTIVQASSYKALVYASRTILQLVCQNKYKHAIPKGIIEDFPNYEKRMLLIDVARKFVTFNELKDFIRIMAWVKMTELHLHLSDNSWGGYSAYRLESKLYPELTAKDGHYSWKEIRELQDFAHSYGITITPEIDSPGHSLAFTNVRPDLKSKWLAPKYLDITNPDVYPFMEKILEEVIPHFDAPDFHLGTDEYRINSIKNDSLKLHIGETFRKYINHFNKVVKKNHKTTRIWSGFEHMPGDTEIDKDIIIDMWETSDAQNKSKRGYKFINSTHFYTYIVPGAPYYGVNNKFIYERWTPEIFSNKDSQNLSKNSPGLLGSKLHIWNDYGPTGFSISEIARLSTPSILVFSEKMWGTKSDLSFEDYKNKLKKLTKIPMTTILERNFTKKKEIYSKKRSINLAKKQSVLINKKIKNIEYPWTLELTVYKTKEGTKDNVLFSSKLATIYADLEFDFKKKKEVITKRGIAIVRANQTEGKSPITSYRPQVIVFDYQIPLNKNVKIKLVGEQGKTSLYINDKLIGSENIQMLCPVNYIGISNGNVFNGTIKEVSIMQNAHNYNYK